MDISLFTGLLEGGAANAAKQLQRGLQSQGVNCRLYHPAGIRNSAADSSIVPLRWSTSGWLGLGDYLSFRLHRTAFKRDMRRRPSGNEIFTSPRGAPRTPWPAKNHVPADHQILHLHWVAKFIDYASFFGSLPSSQPVVWTLHDMNPFTGGCHFACECQRFQQACGHCPQLPDPAEQDWSRRFHSAKRAALRDVNLHVVAASGWMLDQARSSPVFENAKSFHRIPYGLRLDHYPHVDRQQARSQLGIDPDAFVFSFGAVDINNRRKGAKLLLDSLASLTGLDRVEGLVLGGGQLPEVDGVLPKLTSMGFVKEPERRSLIYAASDVFVLPSTEDNMPLTGLEALASGTPIVGFDAGGIPDFVRPGQTGQLAAKADANDLGNQLRWFYDHPEEATRMGKAAREMIEAEFQDHHEAAAYIKLYAALLAGNE